MTGSQDDSAVSGPERAQRYERAKTSALAALRQATWEATQFLNEDEVSKYVEGVLDEVADDAP